MVFFKTTDFSGYAVEWSPFERSIIAVAAAQHYGIVGNGRLYILDVGDRDVIVVNQFDTRDGLYDCAWSESNEQHLICGSGDGIVRLYDTMTASVPIKIFEEHTREVYSVDWNLVTKDTFISGSWDNSIKLWSPERKQSFMTWREHDYCIYSSIWSPSNGDVFATTSGDHTLKIWDINQRGSVQTIKAHNGEVLTCDWNKWNEFHIVTGSVDKTVKVWDIRYPNREVQVLRGHEYAVRRVKCDPHKENVVASVSYDMSTIIWDYVRPDIIQKTENHTEFVLGVDFSIFTPGQIATCSWDETVFAWNLANPESLTR